MHGWVAITELKGYDQRPIVPPPGGLMEVSDLVALLEAEERALERAEPLVACYRSLLRLW